MNIRKVIPILFCVFLFNAPVSAMGVESTPIHYDYNSNSQQRIIYSLITDYTPYEDALRINLDPGNM